MILDNIFHGSSKPTNTLQILYSRWMQFLGILTIITVHLLRKISDSQDFLNKWRPAALLRLILHYSKSRWSALFTFSGVHHHGWPTVSVHHGFIDYPQTLSCRGIWWRYSCYLWLLLLTDAIGEFLLSNPTLLCTSHNFSRGRSSSDSCSIPLGTNNRLFSCLRLS